MSITQPHRTLVLASESPRRRSLLTDLGFDVEFGAAHIDEAQISAGLAPAAAALTLAVAKARVVAATVPADRVVLGADTVVVLDGEPIGKPVSDEQLMSWMRAYSRRSIQVVTGVAVVEGQGQVRGHQELTELVTTTVEFGSIDPAAIESYVASGVGVDKAGGLELQGRAGPFIAAVHGCWTNVIGLPLCAATRLCATLGVTGVGDPRDCPPYVRDSDSAAG